MVGAMRVLCTCALVVASNGEWAADGYNLLRQDDGSYDSYALLMEDGSYDSYNMLLEEDGSYDSYSLLMEDGSYDSYSLLMEDGSYDSYNMLLQEDGSYDSYSLLMEDGSYDSYSLLMEDGSYDSYSLLMEDGSYDSYSLLMEDGSYDSYSLLMEDGSYDSYSLLMEDGSYDSYSLLMEDGSYDSYALLMEDGSYDSFAGGVADTESLFNEDGVVTSGGKTMPAMPTCMSDCTGVPTATSSESAWCAHVSGYSAAPTCLSDCTESDVSQISHFQDHCATVVLAEDGVAGEGTGDDTAGDDVAEDKPSTAEMAQAAETYTKSITSTEQMIAKHGTALGMVMAGIAFMLTVVAMVLKARAVRSSTFKSGLDGDLTPVADGFAVSAIHAVNENVGVQANCDSDYRTSSFMVDGESLL
jgi:hypothetical protein